MIQTRDHRFVVNRSGVVVYEATEEIEPAELSRAEAWELQFGEVLSLVDHVLQHREEYEQTQAELRQTWLRVSDELIDRFETEATGRAREVNGETVQHLLHTLGPIPFHSIKPAKSAAGMWYQAPWASGVYGNTFGQQWVPFLRMFFSRLHERFPQKKE